MVSPQGSALPPQLGLCHPSAWATPPLALLSWLVSPHPLSLRSSITPLEAAASPDSALSVLLGTPEELGGALIKAK